MKNILPLSTQELNLFNKLLIEESGISFDKHGSQSLQFAIHERIQKRGHDSYQEFYNFLKFHPEGWLEIKELLDLVTIGETYFFRNSHQFDVLMRSVLPEIIQRKMYSQDKSIRVWSAGCSTGDEPYSVAMAILELLPSYKSWNISILGTDINRNALNRAKEAVYKERTVSYLPEGYLDKYFRKIGANYILNDNVKKLVEFECHNLAKVSFVLEKMQNLDIIFCRNVFIYFDSQAIRKVIEKFYECLNKDGYLFIGHAETLWEISNKFEVVMFPQTFIYKKALHPVKEELIQPFIGVPEIKLEKFIPHALAEEVKENPEVSVEPVEVIAKSLEAKPSEIKEELKSLYEQAVRFFNEKEYQKSLSLFDKIIARDKNHIRAYFVKATILANQGKYKEAIDELKKITEVDNLYTEAYYLLGVLFYKTEDFKGAEAQFKKVIYIDPGIVLAYFNLGNIYLYQKKLKDAIREFNNVIKLLKEKPKEEEIRFCEGLDVDFLLRACEKNIERIK